MQSKKDDIMKFSIGSALLMLGLGSAVMGLWGTHIDFLGTYMMGVALVALAAGLIDAA